MAEYISRDAAIRLAEDGELYAGLYHDRRAGNFYKKMKRDLLNIPAADVRPVVRGKWTRVDYEPCGHDYICSECGCKSDGPWNFCHDCGADMREVKADG